MTNIHYIFQYMPMYTYGCAKNVGYSWEYPGIYVAPPVPPGARTCPFRFHAPALVLSPRRWNPIPSDLVSRLYPHQLIASDFGTLDTYLLYLSPSPLDSCYWAGDFAVRLLGRWFDSLAPFVFSDHTVPISLWSCCSFIAYSPDAY